MVRKLNRRKRKGSEKPIEIFVSLFIILAVAMVLLKIFSQQTEAQTSSLNKQMVSNEVEAGCNNLCSQAQENNCRVTDLIQFCTKKFKLDLNNDKMFTDINNGAYTFCEDSYYCPMKVTCRCGEELNLQNCLNITYKYYKEHHLNGNLFEKAFPYRRDSTSKCNSNNPLSWYSIYHVPSYIEKLNSINSNSKKN